MAKWCLWRHWIGAAVACGGLLSDRPRHSAGPARFSPGATGPIRSEFRLYREGDHARIRKTIPAYEASDGSSESPDQSTGLNRSIPRHMSFTNAHAAPMANTAMEQRDSDQGYARAVKPAK